jgi:hypothetical protein
VALVNHQIGSESVVREQGRAAAQWRACCASDDALRRRINVQLSQGRLPSIHGGSGPVKVTASMTESRVREWLRDHQGSAHCARCVARDLGLDVGLAGAAIDELSPRQAFSRSLCACQAIGLRYG